MNTQEKKEALVQAVEEIAGKEAAYWEGNPKMQETFRNCYVKYCKKPRQNFLRAGSVCIHRRYRSNVAERFFCTGRSLSAISERISNLKRDGKRADRPSGKVCTY